MPAPLPQPPAAVAAPDQAEALRQVGLLQAVKATWQQPRAEALSSLLSLAQQLDDLPDARLAPPAAYALRLLARYLRTFGGDPVQARAALDRAQAWAERHQDTVLQTHLAVERGCAWDGETGLGPALRHFNEALRLARSLLTQDLLQSVWMQLGQRLVDAGLCEEGMRCLEEASRAAADARGPTQEEYQMVAQANLAWAALLLHDPARALDHLSHWAELQRQARSFQPDARHVSSAYEGRALALLGLNRPGEALEAAQVAQQWAERSQAPYAITGARLALGRALVANGRSDEGFALLQQTVEQCRADVGRNLYAALLSAANTFQDAQQPEVALMYLMELYTLKRQLKAQALADLETASAQTLATQGEQVRALTSAPLGSGTIATQGLQAPMDAGSRRSIAQLNLLLEEHAVAAERLDDTTGAQCYRVGRLSALLGEAIGLGSDTCFLLDLSARLHDVGKLMVPDEIIMKPARLTPAERQVMQNHTLAGWEILGKTRMPQMHIAQEIARHHHEWWNGQGYPDRLSGHGIPIAARVSALVDVFDALTHARPYKAAWPVDQALAEIRGLRGLQFDPELTDVFLDLVARLRADYADLDLLLAEEAQRSSFVGAREEIARQLKGSDPSVTRFRMDGLQALSGHPA